MLACCSMTAASAAWQAVCSRRRRMLQVSRSILVSPVCMRRFALGTPLLDGHAKSLVSATHTDTETHPVANTHTHTRHTRQHAMEHRHLHRHTHAHTHTHTHTHTHIDSFTQPTQITANKPCLSAARIDGPAYLAVYQRRLLPRPVPHKVHRPRRARPHVVAMRLHAVEARRRHPPHPLRCVGHRRQHRREAVLRP